MSLQDIYMILGMFAATFSTRFVLFAMAGQIQFPPLMRRIFTFVPPVVLMAIISPSILIPDGKHLHLAIDNPYIIGGAVAFAAGLWRKNLLLTIVIGMIGFLAGKWAMAGF